MDIYDELPFFFFFICPWGGGRGGGGCLVIRYPTLPYLHSEHSWLFPLDSGPGGVFFKCRSSYAKTKYFFLCVCVCSV